MSTDTSTGPTLRSAIFHALRVGFRALPISEAARDGLRQRFLERFPTIRPATPQGQAVPTIERRARVHAGSRAIGYIERSDELLPVPIPATLVAFYLPQFHTIPENDAWWGKGFTEWRNVARALPQFEGHAQPRLPADLGFYDLRNPQVLRDQAELAQVYGIGAFCMYFYWFGGETLLELPHQQWLNDPSISLPICLCWANENWTRTWDGRVEDVLIAQQHSPEDDLAYIAHVAQYLRDPRYLRVDGKPLLLVYRPGKLPDPRATADRWRQWCRDNDIGELCIGYVQSFERPDPRDIGFDVAVEFPPNLSTPTNITTRQNLLNPGYAGEVLDWRELALDYRQRPLPPYQLFPGVNCGWDNEPRRPGQGRTYCYFSPRGYGDWLSHSMNERLAGVPASDRFVFINAWNEWAEGAVLEPDLSLGHALLEATRTALWSTRRLVAPIKARPCAIIHAWYPEVLEELLLALKATGLAWRLMVTTAPEREPMLRDVLGRHSEDAELVLCENRGRDVLPFLKAARRLRAEGEEIVLKLHTKYSPHRADGDQWRTELVGSLLPPDQAGDMLARFSDDPGLGLIAPAGHLLGLSEHWPANRNGVTFLREQLGLRPAIPDQDLFVAGSMFWVRLAALDPLLDLVLYDEAFEEEAGQLDGTLAHAVERTFVNCVEASGYRIGTGAEVPDRGQRSGDRHYPYTRSG